VKTSLNAPSLNDLELRLQLNSFRIKHIKISGDSSVVPTRPVHHRQGHQNRICANRSLSSHSPVCHTLKPPHHSAQKIGKKMEVTADGWKPKILI